MRVESYARVRLERNPAVRGQLAQESLAALPADPEVVLSRAALEAAAPEQRGPLAELALAGLAEGQSKSALAASLGLAGGQAVALAVLDGPLARVAAGAKDRQTQSAALEVALKGLAAGAPLPATALAMAARGLDDRSGMAQEAVHALDTPACRMGSAALKEMKYRNSSQAVAEIALSAGQGTRALARAASGMLEKAYLGDDGGRWSDEKSGVARACLDFLAQSADRPEERAFAATARAMLAETQFSRTNVAVARLAFDALAGGNLSEREQAALFARMVGRALASDDLRGAFHCDKSEVARVGARALAGSADPRVARPARLLAAALEPGKFSKSNSALAAEGFGAIARGDDDLARLGRKLIESAHNGENNRYRFQADKSAVIKAILPVLEELLPEGKRAYAMFARAHSGTTFAEGYQKNARTMLRAVETGRLSDRELAGLAREMVAGAGTGEVGYAYKDDKTPVALNVARYLSEEAQDPNVRQLAEFLLAAAHDTSFTRTIAGVADRVLRQAERGQPLDRARLGGELVKKALASTSSRGQFVDDKRQVAGNVLGQIEAHGTPEEARRAGFVQAALDACLYARSCEKVAGEGLAALTGGRPGLARLARDLMGRGVVMSDRQDQGPMAAAMADRAARIEPDPGRQKALLLGRGMLDTAADHRLRVKLAGKLLERWESGQSLEPLDTVRWLAGETRSETDQALMLEGALRQLGALKGQDARRAADELVARAEGKVPLLLAGLESIETRFKTTEEEAQALLDSVKGSSPAVREESDYVVIGGVRVRKDRS